MTENEAKAIRWIGNIRDDTVIVKEELLDNNAMCCNILPRIIRQEKNINAEIFINAISELDKYRAIGTVEECREARERQEPMCLCDREAPFIGKSTQIQYRCPQCDIILGIGISEKPIIQEEIRHCFNCGQKLYR